MPIIAYNDWTRGMNDTAAPDNMEDNEARLIHNLIVKEGGLKTRNGSVAITEPLEGAITCVVEMPLADGGVILFEVANHTLYHVDESDGTHVPVKSRAHAKLILPVKPSANDTITIGGKTYTYVSSATADGHIAIGSDVAASQKNTVHAINGTDGLNTANEFARAKAFDGNTCEIAAITAGADGNEVELASSFTSNRNRFTSETLVDGADSIYVASDRIGSVVYKGILYFLDGEEYRQCDTNATRAKNYLILAKQPTAGNTITIGEKTYTFVSSGTADADGDIEIGAALSNTQANVVAAINGTDDHNEPHLKVAAEDFAENRCAIIALAPGSEGNSIATTAAFSDMGNKFSSPTLIDGWDRGADLAASAVVREEGTSLASISKCTMIVLHPGSQRFLAAGNPDDPTALYLSEPGKPNEFKSEQRLYPETALGPIMGLKVFYDAVLVEFRKGWKLWDGTGDALESKWTTLAVPNGVVSGNTVMLTPDSLTYLADDGINILHAAALNQASSILLNKSIYTNVTNNRLDNTIGSIVHPERAVAAFHDNTYYLAYCDDPEASGNNKVLVMDWDTKAFVIYTGWTVYDFCVRKSNDLIFASDNYLIKTGEGFNDVDTETGEAKPIAFEFASKQINPDKMVLGFYDKRATRAFLSAQQQMSPNSTVEWKVDAGYLDSEVHTDMYDSLVWGVRQWGMRWGWTDHVSRQMPMDIDLVGQRFQFLLHADEPSNSFVISSMGLEFENLETYKTTEARRSESLVDNRYFPYEED